MTDTYLVGVSPEQPNPLAKTSSPNRVVMTELAEILATQGYVVADGAMGTQLFAAGLTAGDSPELWNVNRSAEIRLIHRSYIQAGSDLVLTNSFGGSHFRLALHDLADRVVELNEAAARNARAAADEASRPVLVAGSMGPTGSLLEPLGPMTVEDCEAAFAEQAEGLATGGVDLLWIETMSDIAEARAAVRGARSVCDLPLTLTMSFDTAGCTMMGVTGEDLVTQLGPLGLAAIGANCGANIADTEAAVEAISAISGDIPVISKPNAGIPVWRGDTLFYDATPDLLAAHAHRVRAAGVSVMGACCGSTPDHISRIAAVLAGDAPVPDIP